MHAQPQATLATAPQASGRVWVRKTATKMLTALAWRLTR